MDFSVKFYSLLAGQDVCKENDFNGLARIC